MLSGWFYTVNFSFSAFVSLVALFFNLMTLLIVVTHRTHRNIANLLLSNTSLTMLVYCINNLVVSIYGLREDWALNQPLCTFRAYWFTVSCISIAYSYFIQAISRLFFAVLYKHRSLLTYRTHGYLILFNWIVAMILAVKPFFFTNGFVYEPESRLCTLTTKNFVTAMFGIFCGFVIPLTSSIIIYVIIRLRARKSSRRIAPANAESDRSNIVPHAKREMKLIRNMMILIFVFTGGGTPYLITVLWNALASQQIVSAVPDFFYLPIINLNSFCVALMAIALFFLNKSIKDTALHYLPCQYRKQNAVRPIVAMNTRS